MGIPVAQIELVADNKLKFTIATRESKESPTSDLLLIADSFHVAKFLIKHEAYSKGYNVGFLPQASNGSNSVSLSLNNFILKDQTH